MPNLINKNRYNEIVQISDWSSYRQAYPYDNVMEQSASHYKSFGLKNKIYIPKTSTKEAMEIGLKRQTKYTNAYRPITNFSYFQRQYDKVDNDKTKLRLKIPDDNPIPISVYKKDYTRQYKKTKPCPHRDSDIFHRLINRIPNNSFTMINASAPHKFMDNHLYEISQNRRIINVMRQLRNKSNIF